MALLLRILQIALRTSARAVFLFLALFLAYLALTEAWPAYRSLAAIAAQRPALEQELLRLEGELSRRERRAGQIQKQLEIIVASELSELRQNLESFEAALGDAEQRRQQLERDVAEAIEQEREYCTSWNPLKRWVCSEVRDRTARLRQSVEPLLVELEHSRAVLERRVTDARDALARYEHLPPEQRGATWDAQRLRAELGEQLFELQSSRETLSEVRSRLQQARWAEASPWLWMLRQLRRVSWPLAWIVISVMLAPWLQRTLLYFVVMPWVQRAKPLRLTTGEEGALDVGRAERALRIRLLPGERWFARAGFVRPVAGVTRSAWLYDLRAPLVSYASGLSVLTIIEGPTSSDAAAVEATLASPVHSESHLLQLTLRDHPGFVFHPRHLVAVTAGLELTTVWRLFSLHAWMTGQVRYILVRGSGRCVFEGFGEVTAQRLDARPSRIEQELVVGFDTRLFCSTARTETFLPYLLGRTPLVDDVFSGTGVYLWQKNTRVGSVSLAERWFEMVFGALGKLLGF